jgi:WXG100 family type VII secretion target
MADVISIDYERVKTLGNHFIQQSERVRKELNELNSQMQVLRNGGWIADAATAFYQDMESDLLPGVQRLVQALEIAQDVANQISQVMENAEEEASSFLPKSD